jgi:CubicO group peptidase (beta-lactamase class C family)
MPGGSRSLPGRPSLRHLKLEAKRRAAAGEFPSLHEAQVAIAREHGLPTWAALKQRVSTEQDSHALAQLRWVIARFAGAADPSLTASAGPGWTAPGDDELRQHFDDRFLSEIAPSALIAAISKLAADLRDGELVVLRQTPLQAYVELNGVQYIAVAGAQPPYRLSGLRGLPAGSRVRDPRIANPPVRTHGDVPAEVADIAEHAFAELGLTALTLAGGDAQTPTWVLARGWADLDRGEALDPAHRFPVPGATVLVTATAVLKLVADGAIGLDRRANDQLRSIHLADDTITVRELLAHTAGVDSPTQLYADALPDLRQFMGPVVACPGPRGTVHPGNGGIAVLGQLIADVTGMPYAEAATKLVLNPLLLKDSSFPARVPHINSVTGYDLTLEGKFEPVPARIPTLQAVAGLWSTGADLVHLGLGWSSLLPGALAHEALNPQTEPGPGGVRTGLGWIIAPHGDVATHAGANLDATAAVTSRIRDQRTHVVLTSRLIPINTIEVRLLQAWTNPA